MAAETTAQLSSLTASWERREQQWELEKNLADQDYLISDQENKLADDHQQIATQELSVATLQTEHAKAVADYLATKFLNQELYGWMSGVLGDVYASLLQQATAVAALAQQQLAFERQIQPPSFIKEDYWAATPEAGTAATSDRRGLTGSARLLQDVEKLDQYAFENDRRKLDLTQTFSLAALAPFEFERFRSTGVLPFSTPMRLFDQSFPGHYLRLIRRIRISLVALVPPVTGIRATLTASGLSRVVVKNESFQQVTVRRDPEQVALTSPTSASGVFELDVQPEMLLPFEAMGVDTSWEFQLPKPANPIDFANVADVYVTFEYTALADPDYRTQVIAELGRKVSAERSYSLRSDFPDLWYELNNTAEERPRAAFTTRPQDFPPHLDNLKLVHIVFYLVPSGDDIGEIDLDHLHFRPRDSAASDPPLGGPARTTTAGLISTRRANGSSWLTLQNSSPLGSWEFEFGPQLKPLLLDGTVADVLLVLSYTGETPPWPQW
jgi:Tc toxin complex TcA C-terminal TcB-binding domain